jgi:hypothetical protein
MCSKAGGIGKYLFTATDKTQEDNIRILFVVKKGHGSFAGKTPLQMEPLYQTNS